MGKFEAAQGGTIFLDEIGELPEAAQAKMLRLLETRCFERIGSNTSIEVDIRIIAATHRDLRAEVENSNFREDLLYRLNTISITLPPLRERKEDIEIIARHFIHMYLSTKNYLPVRKNPEYIVINKYIYIFLFLLISYR